MARVVYQFQATGADEVRSAFKGVTAAARESARVEASAAAQVSRARVRGAQAGAQASAGSYRQSARLADQQERLASRAIDRETRKREAALRHVARIRDRHFVEQQKQEERVARVAERAQQRIAEARSRTLGRIGSRVAGAGVSAVLAGGAVAAGAVGVAARQALQTQETSNRIAIAARQGGIAGVDPAALTRMFQNVAIATPGQTAEGLAGATQRYQSMTGQLLDAGQLQSLATAASAAGADVEDITAAMAAMSKSMGIKGVDQMKEAMGALIEQGAKGSFELKDAASQYERLTAAAGRFGGITGVEGVKTLGGLTQISRSATGSPEQAATALEATFRQLTANIPQLKKAGVNVVGKGGETRSVVDVLTETIAKVGGKDVEAKKVGLQKIFGEEGIRAISPLIQAFSDATIKGKDGMAAMLAVINDATQTTRTWSDVERDAAQAQTDATAQLTSAWERVKAEVGEQVLPALMPLLEAAPELAMAMAPLIAIFGEAVGAIATFLKLIPGVDSDKIDRHVRRAEAQKELGEVNKVLASVPEIGAPSAEQAAALEKKNQLEYEIAASRAADKMPTAAAPGEEQIAGSGRRTATGMLIGGAIGMAVGGKPGAVVGAAGGAMVAAGSDEQARQAAALRSQGYLETSSGAVMPAMASGGGGGGKPPSIDTTKAQAALDGLGTSVASAIAKILAAQQANAGSI